MSPKKRKKSAVKKRISKKIPASRRNKAKKTSWLKRLFKWLVKWCFVAILWGVFLFMLAFLYFAHDLPDVDSIDQKSGIPVIRILDNKGHLIAKTGGRLGNNLSFEEFPAHLIQAVIATEDRRFFDHFGLDIIGLMRAAYVNFQAGRVVQGGSTITQQLAKIQFLTRDRTFKRKFQEMILAIWLENNFTKQEIITMYLNKVYLGGGNFGVESASRGYFNKSVKQLSLNESALIAGLLKAPSKYSPNNNPDLARMRSEIVLTNMVNAGFISVYDAISKVEFPPSRRERVNYKANYFTDWVISKLPEYIAFSGNELSVRTTIDSEIQKKAQAIFESSFTHRDKMQAALLAATPQGEILAMIGGRNYKKSQFNRSVQSKRQLGSIFKLFVYLTALENGFSVQDLVTDEAISINGWEPKNYNNRSYGQLTLTDAFAKSVNTIAVALSEEVGREKIINMARNLGINSPLASHPSIALGTSEVSLFEILQAYGHIANDGRYVGLHGVIEISDSKGNILYKKQEIKPSSKIAFNHMVDIKNMLNQVVESGTGKNAKIENVKIYGKTGTSQDSRDAWFVGFTDDIITGIWLGNDDNSPMNKVTGGGVPAKIWREFNKSVINEARRYKPYESDGSSPKNDSFWDKFL